MLRQSQSGAGRLFAQQPVFKLRSVTKVKTRCVQEENKEEAALDALLDPERNTMLQMAAADVASSSKLRTASEKQVCRACATDHNAAHDAGMDLLFAAALEMRRTASVGSQYVLTLSKCNYSSGRWDSLRGMCGRP